VRARYSWTLAAHDVIERQLRKNCDMFRYEEIVKECGVVLEDTQSISGDDPEEDDTVTEWDQDER